MMTRWRLGGGLCPSARVPRLPAAATRRLALAASLVGAAVAALSPPAWAASPLLGPPPGSPGGCAALQGASPLLTTTATPDGAPFLYLDTAMSGAAEVATALSAATAAGITAAVGLSPADVGWVPGGGGGGDDAATAAGASSGEPVGDGASGGLGAPAVRAAIRSGHWVVVASAAIPGGLPTALDAFEAATGSRPLFVTDAVAEAEATRDGGRRTALGGLGGAPRPSGVAADAGNPGDPADDESIFGVAAREGGGAPAGGGATTPAGGLGGEGDVGATDAAAAAVAAAACAAHVLVLPAAVVAMREGPGTPGAAGLEGLLSAEQLHGVWDAAACDVVGSGDAAAAGCAHLRRAYAAARGGEELAKFPPPPAPPPAVGGASDGGGGGDGDGGRAPGGDGGGGVGLTPARRRRVEAAYARVRAAATRRAPVREALGVLLSVPAAAIGASAAEEAALRGLGGGAGLSLGVMDRLLGGGVGDPRGGGTGWLGLFRLAVGLVGLWLVLGGALGLWDAWGRGAGGGGRRRARGGDPLGGGLLPVGGRKPPPRGGVSGGVVAAVLSQFAETGKSM